MNEGFVNEFMWNRLNSGSWRKKYIQITHLKHFISKIRLIPNLTFLEKCIL